MSGEAKFTTPEIPAEFIIRLPKTQKAYITASGLIYLGHMQGLKRVTTTVLREPTPDSIFCLVQCEVETDLGVFMDYGEVNDRNRGNVGGAYPLSFATTRARNRALRIATGCPLTSYEELGSDGDDDLDESSPHPPPPPPPPPQQHAHQHQQQQQRAPQPTRTQDAPPTQRALTTAHSTLIRTFRTQCEMSRFAPPPLPTKLPTTADEAEQWLAEALESLLAVLPGERPADDGHEQSLVKACQQYARWGVDLASMTQRSQFTKEQAEWWLHVLRTAADSVRGVTA